MVEELSAAGIRVSLFIAPERAQIEAAAAIRARSSRSTPALGARGWPEAGATRRRPNSSASAPARSLPSRWAWRFTPAMASDYATAGTIAALPELMELNIGHFLIGESIMDGLAIAVRRMRAVMDRGRFNGDAASLDTVK
jgi:pyridoxine 5-phosphate synthase